MTAEPALAAVERYAALQFVPDDIAGLTGVAASAMLGDDEAAAAAYRRGHLLAEADVRAVVRELALEGDARAREQYLRMAAEASAVSTPPAAAPGVPSAGSDLIAAIDRHIEPLALPDSDAATDAELIALAAAEIVRLRAAVAAAKPRRKPAKKQAAP